jgi:protein-L-isoaspartate(D-aspartate) O-methyltransferase
LLRDTPSFLRGAQPESSFCLLAAQRAYRYDLCCAAGMNNVSASSRTSATGCVPGGSRLDAALLHYPRSRFESEHPSLHAELRESPEALTVVTILEALELRGPERVLDVGSPTSYAAALLSALAVEVYSVVATADQLEVRERELTGLGCRNVRVVQGEAVLGWEAGAPYQAILVGAGAQQVPLALLNQMEIGARLVIPIGDARAQLLERLRKRQGAVQSETLGPCHLKMLPGQRETFSRLPWAYR